MKVKTLSALAGLGGAMILSNVAQAAPILTAVVNTTSAYLVSNNLQSATIAISGFAAGEALQGFVGTSTTPFSISTSSGTFFNVGDDVSASGAPFSGAGQTAATAGSAPNQAGNSFDTGILNAASNNFGTINATASNAIGFAQFGVGANSGTGTDVSWLSISPTGVAGGSFILMRLTWARDASATFSGLAITNTGNQNGFEYALSITVPAVPAPGAVALLGLAGLVGSRRRRA